jgi:hypothetical protein
MPREPSRWNQNGHRELIRQSQREDIVMKTLIICVAVLGVAFSTAAEAKGCIKGAIVGGIAGHIAGHGKVGAVAGCVIGHHEANKADADRADQQRRNQDRM